MSNTSKVITLQQEWAKRVIAKENSKKFILVCAVDVSYKNKIAYSSAIIFDINSMAVIESKNTIMKVPQPYIPGLFMLIESRPILKTLKKLSSDFDLLLIDAHGQLHPRKCGLACIIGLLLDKPTIGVAKKLLCGSVKQDSNILYQGDILGYEIKDQNKKIYVSVGHKISLNTAVRIVKELSVKGRIIPAPLRLADLESKKLRKLACQGSKTSVVC